MLCSACVNIFIVLHFYLHFIQALNVGGYVELSMTKGEKLITTSDFSDFSKLKVKKINRTHVVDGEIKFAKGISNEQSCTILLFKKQGGEYRKTEFKSPSQGCCDFYNSETFVVPKLQTHCKSCPKQADKVCPWPAGSYMLDKYLYDAESLPPFMEGDYKATFEISQDNELLGGYSVYATIIR